MISQASSENATISQPPKLLDQVREKILYKQYSKRTEESLYALD